MSRYFYLLLACLFVTLPLELFLGARVYRRFRLAIKSIWLPALVYLIWDVLATHFDHWSFSPKYVSSLKILGLPVEEILFFLIIPLCAILTLEAVRHLSTGQYLARMWQWFTFLGALLVSGIAVSQFRITTFDLMYPSRTFPFYFIATIGIFGVVALIVWGNEIGRQLIKSRAYLQTIAICLFFMIFVNGFLTILDNPVVQYRANIGMRLFFDIPLEDFFYGTALLTWILYRWDARTTPRRRTLETKLEP